MSSSQAHRSLRAVASASTNLSFLVAGRRLQRTLAYGVCVVVSLCFAALAIRDVDFAVFWRGVREMDYPWALPAISALAVSVYLRVVRWRFLFSAETRPATGSATRALLIGLLFNQILPLRAGEAARVVALRSEAGTSRAETLGTTVVERIYDVLTLFILLLAASPFLPSLSWIHDALALGVFFTGAVAAGAVTLVVWGERPIAAALSPLTLLPRITRAHTDGAAAGLRAGLRALHRPTVVVGALVASIAWWSVAGLSYWFVIVGFHFHIGFAGALLVVVTTNLALVVPSLPAGLGVFEAATVLALGAYGITESRALACAVVLHAINFFPYVAAGLLALQRHAALRRRSARMLARSGEARFDPVDLTLGDASRRTLGYGLIGMELHERARTDDEEARPDEEEFRDVNGLRRFATRFRRAEQRTNSETSKPDEPQESAITGREELLHAARVVGDDWTHGPYYDEAERAMDGQWQDMIWPLISNADFTTTIEVAAGHGRNSERLRALAQQLYLVDINDENVEFLTRRFAAADDVTILLNNGIDLSGISDAAATFVYSFDSMVHFDSDVIRAYLGEFRRVLRPGGTGFCHYSNYTANPTGSYRDHPGWRNFMSRELFEHYAVKEGLTPLKSQLVNDQGNGYGGDAITYFRRP